MVQVAISQQIKTLCGKGMGLGAIVTEQGVTFAALTTGAVTSKRLFTVTGTVLATVIAVCDTNVAGTGTLEVGVSGDTACIIAQTTGTDIDAYDVWTAAAPATRHVITSDTIPPVYILNDRHIQYTVGTGTLTGGAMKFYCLWEPISEDGDVAAAGVNATA